jgi:hypothetical protein
VRILRLRLRHYRGVDARELHLLPTGVTVVQGPNEVGKSCIAEALRVVFAHPDHTRRQDVRDLQPVGRDVGTEIEVEATSGAYAFTLSKRFNAARETRLAIAAPRAEILTGRAAHERVTTLLAETLDDGLWRALEAQQGARIGQPALGECPSLVAALDAASCDDAAGARELGLLDRVTEEYRRWFTERGGERKALTEAAQAVTAAQARAEATADALAALEAKLARCEQLECALPALRAAHADAVRRADGAEAAHAAVAARAGEVERLRLAAGAAAAAAATALTEAAQRRALAADAVAAVAEADERAAAAGDAGTAAAAAAHALTAADAAAEAADEQLSAARATLDARAAEVAVLRDAAELTALRARRARLRDALDDAAAARAGLAADTVDEAVLRDLRAAQLELARAEGALAAARSAVTIEAAEAVTVEVDGSPRALAAGEHAHLAVSGTITLALPNHLTVTVAAAADAAAREAALDAAREDCAARCRALGVADLAQAEVAAARRARASAALADAERRVAESLDGDTADHLDAAIAALEPLPDLPATDLATARRAETDAHAGVTAATGAAQAAAQARASSAARVAALSERRDAAAAAAAQARERLEAVVAALAAARAARSDDDLAAAADTAAVAAERARQAFTVARAALAADDPDAVAARAAEVGRACADAARLLAHAERERDDLRARLEERGQDGLAEALADARAALAAAQRRRDALVARAAAARRLYETMTACRDRARDAYAAPLRARIVELGRALFGPTFDVELDADLRIATRILDGLPLPYAALSTGAQEQLAVIARLAAALLVADDGAPVVLDDSLGHSDEQRLERMGELLAVAGQRCQIIVLTCFPDRYRSVTGAKVVSLP